MKWQIADWNRVKINYEFCLSHVGSSGSRLAKPVRDKGLTSVADTRQACKRPRKELRDGTYHKGNQWFPKTGVTCNIALDWLFVIRNS